jgi:hypothetical protein
VEVVAEVVAAEEGVVVEGESLLQALVLLQNAKESNALFIYIQALHRFIQPTKFNKITKNKL